MRKPTRAKFKPLSASASLTLSLSVCLSLSLSLSLSPSSPSSSPSLSLSLHSSHVHSLTDSQARLLSLSLFSQYRRCSCSRSRIMSSFTRTSCILSIAFLLLASVPEPTCAVVHLQSDELDVQSIRMVRLYSAFFQKSFNSQDVSILREFYDDQATLSLPGVAEPFHGLDAICKAYTNLFTVGGVHAVELSIDDVKRVSGHAGHGMYLESGHYALHVITPDGRSVLAQSTYAVLWSVDRIRIRIVRDVISQ